MPAYVRTNDDLTIGNADLLPPVAWYGLDSGSGNYPIGPNGPHGSGHDAPVLARATGLIVDPLAQVPWQLVDTATREPFTQQPRYLTDPQLFRADDRLGPAESRYVQRRTVVSFYGDWIRSALWYGEGFMAYRTNDDGSPRAGTFTTLHPFAVTADRSGDKLTWKIAGEPVSRDGTFGPWRLLILRHPSNPTDADGRTRGVLESYPQTFGLTTEVLTYLRGMFRTGVPAGYLQHTKPGLTQEQADDMRTRWLASHGNGRRSIAVLNASTEFHALNFTPSDAGLADVRRLNSADVAFAFGLDPFMLGASTESGMTYSNTAQRWQHYRTSSLGIWIAAVEAAMSSLEPVGRSVRLDFTEYARADMATRTAYYQAGLDQGWLTRDEVRRREGLPPLAPMSGAVAAAGENSTESDPPPDDAGDPITADEARAADLEQIEARAAHPLVQVSGPPCSGKSTRVRELGRAGYETADEIEWLRRTIGDKPRDAYTGQELGRWFLALDGMIAKALNAGQPFAYTYGPPTARHPSAHVETLDPGADVCKARAKADGRPAVTAQWVDRWYTAHKQKKAEAAA